MVSSINGQNDSNMQQMMALMYQRLGTADIDGTKGLSRSELSSVDTGGDVGASDFLDALTEKFDELDADKNGQLSENEIALAKPPAAMGPPPGLELGTETESESSSLFEQLMKSTKESFAKSFADSDDSVTDSAKASSLLASADFDSSSGLSLGELSSVSTSGGAGKAGFVNDLISNFDKFDLDGDGQLSQGEVESALPKGQYSAQEQKAMVDSAQSSFFDSLENSLSSIGSSQIVQKLISSYQSGGLSNILSSLSMAV